VLSDLALITVGGPGIVAYRDVLGRAFAATAAVRADVLHSQSSSQENICLVVPSALAKRTVEELRRELAQELVDQKVEHITFDPNVAIVTVVGEDMRGLSAIVGRTFGALGRENVDIIAMARGSSDGNFSFVVAQRDMKAALVATHREFHLEEPNSEVPPLTSP
jgi:aspartokinase